MGDPDFSVLRAVVGLILLGCGSAGTPRLAVPDQAPVPDVVEGVAEEAAHAVYYRAGEGFVPARVDVETGARVILINESGQPLTPAFAVRHGHDHSGGGTDDDAPGGTHAGHGEHAGHGGAGARGAADHAMDADSGAPIWKEHPGRADGDRWVHSFDVSGYWRFRNEANPEHAGLVVALPGPGVEDEPLAIEAAGRLDRSFPDPPRPTRDEYAGLLVDREALRRFMETYGPRNALEALRLAEIETGWDCHHSAHHLGRMAFAEYGPAVSETVTEVCQSGMRHGLIEQLFVTRGVTDLAEDVAAMCPPAGRQYSRYQCLHGVGHGVMAWTSYELMDALELCDQLSDEWSRTSCYTGVFMENVAGGLSASGRVSDWVDAEDPHYPCNSLPDRYVDDCYWYQTSQMLFVFGNDLLRVAEACGEAPLVGRRKCFGSYGRDVSGAHRGSPHRIVQFCNEAPGSLFRADCIDGAARTLFWDSTQAGAGLGLCELVEERVVAETCYESVVGQAHLVLPAADLEPFCGQLPERWLDRCRAPLGRP